MTSKIFKGNKQMKNYIPLATSKKRSEVNENKNKNDKKGKELQG